MWPSFAAPVVMSCFEGASEITWRKRKLITARARKNTRTACMVANARKDHIRESSSLHQFKRLLQQYF